MKYEILIHVFNTYAEEFRYWASVTLPEDISRREAELRLYELHEIFQGYNKATFEFHLVSKETETVLLMTLEA